MFSIPADAASSDRAPTTVAAVYTIFDSLAYIGFTAMGLVTWWLVRTRLAERREAGAPAPPVLAALAIVALGIALAGAEPAVIAAATALAALAYLGLLVVLRRVWLVELAAAVRERGGMAR